MITDIINKLVNDAPSFTTIENARNLQPENADPADLPAAFVFRNSAAYEPSNADNCIRQRQNIVISVYLVCNYQQHQSLEDELFAALLGWQYEAAYGPLECLSDEPVAINGHVVWHEYQFRTWRTIKET